jgi:hypothetical protein
VKTFQLERDVDVSGVSGTGIVAEGVEFSDGTVAIRWLTQTASVVIYSSFSDAVTIHSHDGATRFVFGSDQ